VQKARSETNNFLFLKISMCVNPVCKSFNATFHVLALDHFIMNDQWYQSHPPCCVHFSALKSDGGMRS
jgi:hypothetical protein